MSLCVCLTLCVYRCVCVRAQVCVCFATSPGISSKQIISLEKKKKCMDSIKASLMKIPLLVIIYSCCLSAFLGIAMFVFVRLEESGQHRGGSGGGGGQRLHRDSHVTSTSAQWEKSLSCSFLESVEPVGSWGITLRCCRSLIYFTNLKKKLLMPIVLNWAQTQLQLSCLSKLLQQTTPDVCSFWFAITISDTDTLIALFTTYLCIPKYKGFQNTLAKCYHCGETTLPWMNSRWRIILRDNSHLET